MKWEEENRRGWFGVKGLNSVLAYAASMMLTGVPPVVCESVLEEVYSSMRKSLGRVRI